MPAERSTKNKAGSTGHLSNNVEPCIICGKVVSRTSDIPRHMKKHDSGAKKFPCPWEGCEFSTLQKSNLETHYRRHTQDRSFLCTDDSDCTFQTCDPASLLRHRKRLHGYVPRLSNGRKTGKAPTNHGRKASIASSSSGASPSSVESSWESNSRASTSPSSSTSALSPKISFSGESESTPSTPETHSSLNGSVSSRDSSSSPLPRQQSLLFSDNSSPCSYNYAWDALLLPELEFLTVQPEMEQTEFQIPYQGQQKEPQATSTDGFLSPLQLPNIEQVFPGYETSGHLHGSHGLEVGSDQQHQRISWAEVNNNPWFGLSVTGSPTLQHHNLPAESFQAPVEIQYSPGICSPVRTGSLELDMEVTSGSDVDIRLDSAIPWYADYAPMTSSSCDFNYVFCDPIHPSPKLADLATFTDATYVQPYQTPSASIFQADVNLQTYDSTNSFASGFSYFDHSQLTNLDNGEVNSDSNDLTLSGDYFDQCQWDFGFNPAFGIVQGPPGGGLQNAFMFSS